MIYVIQWGSTVLLSSMEMNTPSMPKLEPWHLSLYSRNTLPSTTTFRNASQVCLQDQRPETDQWSPWNEQEVLASSSNRTLFLSAPTAPRADSLPETPKSVTGYPVPSPVPRGERWDVHTE